MQPETTNTQAQAQQAMEPLFFSKGAPTEDMLLSACGMTKRQAWAFLNLLQTKLDSLNYGGAATRPQPYICNEWHASCICQRSGLFYVVLRVGMQDATTRQQIFFDEHWGGTVGAKGKLRSSSDVIAWWIQS